MKKLNFLIIAIIVCIFYAPIINAYTLTFDDLFNFSKEKFKKGKTVNESKKETKITKSEFDEVKAKFLKTYTQDDQTGFRAIKKIVEAGSKVAIHADIHGDEKATLNYIKYCIDKKYLDNKFKIIADNFYLVFLGDFADRAYHSLEVLYAAMRLRAENPDKVEILRGNHEDVSTSRELDFSTELLSKKIITNKKIETKELENLLDPIFNALPSVMFLGVENNKHAIDYVMLIHGGIEPRFDPNDLLKAEPKSYDRIDKVISERIDKLDTKWLSSDLKNDLQTALGQEYMNKSKFGSTKDNGFLLGDFIIENDTKIEKPIKRSVIIANFGQQSTEQYLKLCSEINKYNVNAIIRGHQHSDAIFKDKMIEYNGIFGLWETINNLKQWDGEKNRSIDLPRNSVWTLLVSPASEPPKSKQTFDIHVILQTAEEFKDWKLLPTKIEQ